VQTPEGRHAERVTRTRRRDRHGRGLRGVLAPQDVPLHRTRAERFDDLVLQAVARLEPQWEAHLAGVEFAVEEIPPAEVPAANGRGPVPLSRLDPGSAQGPEAPAPEAPAPGAEPEGEGVRREVVIKPDPASPLAGEAAGREPPRIVVYRRPLMARADGDDDLGELVFDVVVEEFARLLGIDPRDVDSGYSGGD
jgi:predicted Zn-dependent protease with MMP-like domain